MGASPVQGGARAQLEPVHGVDDQDQLHGVDEGAFAHDGVGTFGRAPELSGRPIWS